jgi:hypothetical protein
MMHVVPVVHSTRAPHRGVAVVLALIAVSVATLLGLSLATSRDATVATSSNLSKVATARAAAASGLDLASSMLAREGALASLSNGVLFEDVEINGSRVRAEVRDLETGRAATEDSAAIEIVVSGNADGLQQVARAVGRAPATDTPMRADLDCSEFALLGTESISVQPTAHVGVWEKSPLAALGEPVRIGNAAGSARGVDVSDEASTHGCVALRQAAFTNTKESFDEALAAKLCAIPAAIHVPDAPLPEEPRNLAASPQLLIDGLVSASAASSGDARVPARGSATIRGTVRLDVGGNLFVERGSRLFVEGAAVIVVRGNAVLDAGTVEVGQTGSLTVIALGDLTLSSMFVGGARSDPSEARDATGQAAYDGGASRIVIFSSGDGRVLIADGSVVKGQVYAPDARVDVESRSAVYGRVLGRQVVLHEGVALYYDPTLDARRGWSNADSGIWTAAGTVNPEVRGVGKLDDASLLDFAASTGLEPDPPSLADAAVVVATETIANADFDDRVEELAGDDVRKLRKLIKSRLLQRVEEIKRQRQQTMLEPVEGSGSGFKTSGFVSVGFDGDDDDAGKDDR